MKNKNDGGPAFPYSDTKMMSSRDSILGMSLRDYFAIHASEKDIMEIMHRDENHYSTGIGFECKISRNKAKYIFADEMLKAREG